MVVGTNSPKIEKLYLDCQHTTSLNSTIRGNKHLSPCTHAFISLRLTLPKSLSYPSNLQKRKIPSFSCAGLPIGSHKEFYRIGKAQFQRRKNKGWLQQTS